MTNLILFNKPFGVLSQFRTKEENTVTLASFLKGKSTKNFYPAGRLDRDSEGLLLLTNDGKLQSYISHPKHKWSKTYWVQVEGNISNKAINQLQQGLYLKDGQTLPAKVRRIQPPNIWPRTPPIRVRKNIPDCWIELTIKEGKNRQVRRMTAATGFPTLRLIRCKIGKYSLSDLKPGEYTTTTHEH